MVLLMFFVVGLTLLPLSFPLFPIPLVQRKHAPILLKRHFGASALFLLVFDLLAKKRHRGDGGGIESGHP